MIAITPPIVGPPPPSRLSADLVDRLVARDPAAFETLVRLHGPRLLAVASRYLPRAPDAEDAVQDAFVNVVRFVGTFNRASAFETWLHRIVVNSALMILRTRRRHPLVTNADVGLEGERSAPARATCSTRPDDAVAHAERDRRLHASIHGLPSLQACAFLSRYRDGMGVPAIANTFGVSRSTVRNWLQRARRTLQVQFAGDED